jgi:YD repeat-containing protein
MNRLTTKTPDPSFNAPAVRFTYTKTGKRNTMTDASGATSYGYDGYDRLSQVSKPAGGLGYQYDLASNLTLVSGGLNVYYYYDALNRLEYVQEINTGWSTYTYDNVGNLASVTYPNGVVHSYSYDTRNRLTNLAVNNPSGAVASYGYTLDAAGHRTSVTDLSGRKATYTYDNIYRLTSETIASDPGGQNGVISYTYDPVGNRTQQTSTVPAIPSANRSYDANDRFTAGDLYDNNGNTISSGGTGYVGVYPEASRGNFENHLIQKDGVTMVYDGDGNRVQKTVAGVTMRYLVSDLNPTGYSQVTAETQTNGLQLESYIYGLEQIARVQQYGSAPTVFYVHDGHGSVRALTNKTGAVTDTYDYDAFGNLIHSTGSTPNNYLFAGEQYDPDLHL